MCIFLSIFYSENGCSCTVLYSKTFYIKQKSRYRNCNVLKNRLLKPIFIWDLSSQMLFLIDFPSNYFKKKKNPYFSIDSLLIIIYQQPFAILLINFFVIYSFKMYHFNYYLLSVWRDVSYIYCLTYFSFDAWLRMYWYYCEVFFFLFM